jgi:hypothetical protein
VSSVLAYLCLTRFFFCFALSHESAVLLLFISHGLLLLAFAFFLTTGWTDGWIGGKGTTWENWWFWRFL